MFDYFGFFDPDTWSSVQDDMRNAILTYVPEAEFLPYVEAARLAAERSEEAAELLLDSLVEGGVL